MVLSYIFTFVYAYFMAFILQLFYRPGAQERLVRLSTIEQVGSLYEDLRINPYSFMFPVIFITKRAAFVYMAMFVQDAISCLFCFYVSTVSSIVFLASVKPKADKKMLKLEIFNEMITLAFIASLSGFVGPTYNAE